MDWIGNRVPVWVSRRVALSLGFHEPLPRRSTQKCGPVRKGKARKWGKAD
jgi:hypothetical protein